MAEIDWMEEGVSEKKVIFQKLKNVKIRKISKKFFIKNVKGE